VGCYFLLSSLVQRLMNLYWGHTIVYEVLDGILDSLPRLLFCGVIIVIGILLIGGKRPKEVEANDEE